MDRGRDRARRRRCRQWLLHLQVRSQGCGSAARLARSRDHQPGRVGTMTHSSVRRWLALAAMALVPIVPLTTSCSEDTLPVKGQLMLVITTNLAPPKDFDTLHVRINEEGSA